VHTRRMLTPDLAQEITTSITAAIGFTVLVTDRDGRVIGNADPVLRDRAGLVLPTADVRGRSPRARR
jgi:hypothetical protein